MPAVLSLWIIRGGSKVWPEPEVSLCPPPLPVLATHFLTPEMLGVEPGGVESQFPHGGALDK